MRSFSDVKRRIQVGATFRCVKNTKRPEMGDGRTRVVTKAQGNSIRWSWADDPKQSPFWTPWPPAKETEILGPDTVKIGLGKPSVHDDPAARYFVIFELTPR